MSRAVTAVIVSYADAEATARAVRSMLGQTEPPHEIIVVDNDPHGAARAALAAAGLSERVRVLHRGVNLGYTRAANLAARQAHGDWLFFLNPDAVASPECLKVLLAAIDGSDVALIGAQVLLPDGRVNAGDNPINLAGICWSGGYGGPPEHGQPREVAAVSGAAMLARRRDYLDVGGMCPHFFMYYDDADLAWRMRLAGRRVRYCPQATVMHEYEFEKGAHKWLHLERNRLWALASNLQLSTLALLSPLLLATEALVVRQAISHGWLAQKARAWGWLARHPRELARWRRAVQTTRNVSDYRVLRMFAAGIDTPAIETGVPGWADRWLRLYRALVLRALQRRLLSGRRRSQP
jgi:GT2 family glycosyltransferase